MASHPGPEARKSPAWLKPATDFGPLLVFFATYFTAGFLPATAAIMAATVVALAVTYAFERRVAVMPLVTAVIIGIFGALTLWLQDETFFKMKPPIVQAIFALLLFGGLAMGRPLLKPLMGAAWSMDDTGWRKLTFRFGLFFAAMALLNELVWRTQSTDFWVTFKVFGIMALTFAFVLSQIYFMRAHMATPEADGEEDRSRQQGD